MPVRNIYVTEADLSFWIEAETLAIRRDISLSKLTSSLIKDYVEKNHQGAKLGLPVGFAIPESMKDPKELAAEAAADDIRTVAMSKLLDVLRMGDAS